MHFKCHSILPGYGDFIENDEPAPPPPAPRSLEELMLTQQELDVTMHMIERLREKYIAQVNTVPVAKEGEAKSVFQVPIIVGDAGEKGRGVYAKEDIPKGTLVLDIDSDNVGIFKDAMEWRQFTYTLGVEDEVLSCNFMEWCWVQRVEKDEGEADDIRHGMTVFLVFDESGLINNAEWGDEGANIRCGTSSQQDGEKETWSACKYHYYASRDIKAGEELLINYSEFEDVEQTGWVDFGVGIGFTIIP